MTTVANILLYIF